MPENETNEVMTTVYDSSEEADETDGTPVGLILVAGGFIVGGLIGIGRKIFGKKKYAEVDRVKLVKEK